MNPRYRKTEAGRAEIRARQRTLSRPARNLLLIVDDSRPAAEWLAMVAGVTPADLQALADGGLVEAVAGPAAAPSAAPAPAPAALRLDEVPFRPLYDYLTAQARPRLGLVAGYRAVLEIERCSGPEALRRYALQFVEQVRQAQGEVAAREVARELAGLSA